MCFQSLTLFCRAFNCSTDVIADIASWTSPRSYYRRFFHLYPKAQHELYPKHGRRHILSSLFSTELVLWVSSGAAYDEFWTTNQTLRECTFSLLSCRNEWCVHSMALAQLVRFGPLDEIGVAVEDWFRVKVQGKEKEGRILEGSGLNLWFDIGLHIRTLTM